MFFYSGIIYAQVNTETLRAGSLQDGFRLTTNFNFGLAEGNTSYLNLLGNVRLDHQKNNNRSFAVIQYSRAVQDDELFQNAGFLALRNTNYFKPEIGWEIFAQQQFDEFLRLRDRKLIGSGMRLRLYNVESTDEEKKLQLILGVGGMYEYEDIDAIIPETHSLIRSTNYLSVQWVLNARVSMNAVTYMQIAVSDLMNYRNLLESSIAVKLAESLSLTVGVNHRYDSKPPAGVEPYDIIIRNGLQLLF